MEKASNYLVLSVFLRMEVYAEVREAATGS